MCSGGMGIRNERGSTIALIAVCLFAMLAMGALAIDLAVIRDARGEAQRAADAIALAGASAFRDFPVPDDPATMDSVQTRALDIARANRIRADTIDIRNMVVRRNDYLWGWVRTVTTNEVTLNIIPAVDSQKVRAWVHRSGAQTFFAGLLARPYGHVTAMSTAWASNAGPKVPCLKPFVIPDMWYESDKATQDKNSNNYMEPNITGPGNGQTGEIWKYQPASVGGSDYYLPYSKTPPPTGQVQTGYGSSIRNGVGYQADVGLPLILKPQTGNGNGQPAPERMGNAFWLLDLDPNAGVEDEIKFNCSEGKVGDPVPYENGSHTGPTKKGVNYLIGLDPSAVWNQSTGQVDYSSKQNWRESPRVITVGLIDPKYWTTISKNTKPDPGSLFSNFAIVFLEQMQGNDNIQARFVGPAAGTTGGPVAGPLVRTLQLIE